MTDLNKLHHYMHRSAATCGVSFACWSYSGERTESAEEATPPGRIVEKAEVRLNFWPLVKV